MNKSSQLLSLGAALLLAPLTPTFAQSTWETVDDFTIGKSAKVCALAATGDGAVFSAGLGVDLAGVQHAYVQRSLDAGQTWLQTLDLPANGTATAWAVTVGPHSGLVFAAATLKATSSTAWNNWLTLSSADGGSTWNPVDVVSPPNWKAHPYAVVEDAAGRVFVGGYIGDARNMDHLYIRRSLDGGATWKTVDDVAGGGNQITALTATPAGVFAAGVLRGAWVVRRSTDGGTTWKTVDSFLATGPTAWPRGMAADTSGILYVTGRAQFLVKKAYEYHWITRKSSDGGATWRTVDDTLGGTASGFGEAVTVDALGRVLPRAATPAGPGAPRFPTGSRGPAWMVAPLGPPPMTLLARPTVRRATRRATCISAAAPSA